MTTKQLRSFPDNFRVKLIKLYKEHKGEDCKDNLYCNKHLTIPDDLKKLTNKPTLADKFADDLIAEATPLLSVSASSDLLTSMKAADKSYSLEIVSLIKWLEKGIEINKMSHVVKDSLMKKKQSSVFKTLEFINDISENKDLFQSLEELREHFAKSSRLKKPRENEIVKMQAEWYIDRAYQIFLKHHLPFSPTSESATTYTLAVIVLKTIFDTIPGFIFDEKVISNKVKFFKTVLNKDEKEAEELAKEFLSSTNQ